MSILHIFKYLEKRTHSFSNSFFWIAQCLGGRVKGTKIYTQYPFPEYRIDSKSLMAQYMSTEKRKKRATMNKNQFRVKIHRLPLQYHNSHGRYYYRKILIRSTLSTKNTKFIINKLKNLYLNTLMESYKYINIPINVIPK